MTVSTQTKHWYLVYTKPRQEEVAGSNLTRQGFETYLPRMRQRRVRMHRRVLVVEPMFPRYLFIRLDAHQDNWAPIRSTLGVTSLVRFGPYPTPVPEDLVPALRANEDEQGIQNLPPPDFRQGQALRIAEGALAGYEGIFLARSGKDRVVVLLDILGKQARVAVDRDAVEPIS